MALGPDAYLGWIGMIFQTFLKNANFSGERLPETGTV